LHCAAQGLLACVACYQPQDLDALLPALQALRVPVLLHLQPDAAASRAFADAVRASPKGEVYVYSDGAAGGLVPGGPGAPPSAGIAHSRTLALLRATIGPRYDLSALWDAHRDCEFVSRDADATMRTMVGQPYVNHVPTMIGGYGARDLHHFYSRHFIPNNPADMRSIPVSRTVGADRVVNETILCFTHDREIEWMLPGIAPTGRYVEVALIGIITFRGGKLAHEHIYWDQASVLVQIGLLDPAGLPVAGAEAARKVLDPSLPSNALLRNWSPP
jgi:carboxymethylenebutenolidase